MSAGVLSRAECQSISTVLPSLLLIPSSSVQDAAMILAIEMRINGVEEWKGDQLIEFV